MIELKEKQFNVLLNFFFSQFFCDGLENVISSIVFSIPAVKGIEFGAGFSVADMKGSENNDEFYVENGVVKTKTNNCGGILGGISNGMPILTTDKVGFNDLIKNDITGFVVESNLDSIKNKITTMSK